MRRAIAVAILSIAVSSPAFADKPDGWITMKTKLALWTTGGIPSTDVNVDTINGVVTLHGKVESDTQRVAAEREAKKIDGVRQVRNLLQVVPGRSEKAIARSDKELKDAVEKDLKRSDRLSSVSIRSVNDGVVLLGGKTDTINDELFAVRCAAGVPGVRRVASEIKADDRVVETDYDMSARRDEVRANKSGLMDGWITSDVKLRLIADANVPALDINVDTKDGLVTLFGKVPSEMAKADAEADARKVKGVTSINNELQIVPSSRKEVVKAKDDVIEKDVKKAFSKNDALSHIDVEVKGGMVRLTGTVPSHFTKLEAATVSRSTPGVRAVSNELEVKKKND